MNSLIIAVLAYVGFIIAYRTYGTYLSKRIFNLDPNRQTPAHEFEDGMDFVPTKKEILFGHHFTSIAGAAPIVGPAIAVMWGWVPALLWVVFGSIFMGAVHDFGALVLSARHQGRSVSDITKDLIGPRARTLFLLLTMFALLIVIAVFGLVIAVLFTSYPQSVLPIWFEIPIAIAVGYYLYKKSGNSTLAGLVAVVLMYVFVIIGVYFPIEIPAFIGGNIIYTWVVILLIYAYIASTLPVWVLLQPRDYINSHQLYVGLGLMFLGLVVSHPPIVAPAVNMNVADGPAFLPFLFITIACGALSGFHSMAASGTTVKQLDNETDAKAIGYGAMLMEGALAVMAILAATAGFKSLEAWNGHYASWAAASGLGAKVGAFVEGGATFVNGLGIPLDIATGVLAVLVVSFASTTLDSATRIQRYIIAELAEDLNIKVFTKRHPATLLAVVSAFILASINGGKGGLILWPLFGATNQLMAGLALLVVTVWLLKLKKPTAIAMVPMIFIIFMTSWAMLINVRNFIASGNTLLLVLSVLMIALEIWVIIEAIFVYSSTKKTIMDENIKA
ncbi:carbon starvation protein A [Metallumcola ferriviriculae]|uniref:Carbon starvation protein A n=1 Tax=Metallumcola ferriviriculae TaxID=3039180 RepID=A0AAU0UJP6_9FIRM|nr:carbon starvation protein A [Desulfitibacteraceae bacterium MK1]